ncbi:MAG: IS110 family transposase [Acidimicrobiia bacterium]|nr:IS110 family transposase [Acidimicrobiia bacterium]
MSAKQVLTAVRHGDATLTASKNRVTVAVDASGTSLNDIYGVGPIGAAQIIGYVGDINRFPTRARLAAYNSTAPIEASSGGRRQTVTGITDEQQVARSTRCDGLINEYRNAA